MLTTHAPYANDPYSAEQAEMLISSFKLLTGKDLVPPKLSGEEAYRVLFEAPFAVLSHDTARDPLFNYANFAAQLLFEMDWNAITSIPSRQSAEAETRAERARLLEQVTDHGFIEDYRGVRISSTGKRFMIEEAMIWNLFDTQGTCRGQAAALYSWVKL